MLDANALSGAHQSGEQRGHLRESSDVRMALDRAGPKRPCCGSAQWVASQLVSREMAAQRLQRARARQSGGSRSSGVWSPCLPLGRNATGTCELHHVALTS